MHSALEQLEVGSKYLLSSMYRVIYRHRVTCSDLLTLPSRNACGTRRTGVKKHHGSTYSTLWNLHRPTFALAWAHGRMMLKPNMHHARIIAIRLTTLLHSNKFMAHATRLECSKFRLERLLYHIAYVPLFVTSMIPGIRSTGLSWTFGAACIYMACSSHGRGGWTIYQPRPTKDKRRPLPTRREKLLYTAAG